MSVSEYVANTPNRQMLNNMKQNAYSPYRLFLLENALLSYYQARIVYSVIG